MSNETLLVAILAFFVITALFIWDLVTQIINNQKTLGKQIANIWDKLQRISHE